MTLRDDAERLDKAIAELKSALLEGLTPLLDATVRVLKHPIANRLASFPPLAMLGSVMDWTLRKTGGLLGFYVLLYLLFGALLLVLFLMRS